MTIGTPGPRAALLAAVLVTLAATLFYREHRSREREARLMERRLEQLEAGNERARGLAPEGTSGLATRLESYASRIARLEQLIPRSEEVPALLEALAAEARRSGLGDLAFIRPGEGEADPFYTRRSYEVSVEGGYHEVARFLTAVASLARIVTPVGLEMTAIPDPALEGDPGVRAHFRIETYVRPPAETAEGAASVRYRTGSGAEAGDADLGREVFVYPGGIRRDPFRRPVPGDPAGPRFEDLRLIGVVLSPDPRTSVALVGSGAARSSDPFRAGDRTFRLRQGAVLGDMRVVRVGRDHLVFETSRLGVNEYRELHLDRQRGRDGR